MCSDCLDPTEPPGLAKAYHPEAEGDVTDWREQLRAWEAQIAERRPGEAATASGIPLEPLYGPESAEKRDVSRIGYPGQYPYTRGIHASGYRGKPWTFRQY